MTRIGQSSLKLRQGCSKVVACSRFIRARVGTKLIIILFALAPYAQAENGTAQESTANILELPNAAASAFTRGDFEQTIELVQSALDQLDSYVMTSNDRSGIRSMLLGLRGLSYASLGQPARAEEILAKARVLAEESGHPAVLAVADANRAAFYAAHGSFDDHDARDLSERVRNGLSRKASSGESETIAASESALELNMAAEGWDPSRAPGSKGPSPTGPAQSEPGSSLTASSGTTGLQIPPGLLPAFLEAQHAFMAHQYDRVIELLTPVRETLRARGERTMELASLALMAGAHSESLRFDDALNLALEASALYDELIDDVDIDEHLARFTGNWQSVYEMAISLLALKKRPEDAFFYAEKARARSLLRQLAPPPTGPVPAANKAKSETLEALRRQLEAIERDFSQGTGVVAQGSNPDSVHPHQRHERILAQLRLADPAFSSAISITPVTSKAFRHQALDEHTTAIVYYVIGDSLLTWVMERDGGAMLTTPLPAAVTGPGGAIERFVESLRAGSSETETAELARRLYGYLFAPLRDHIRHPNIVIIPHGQLHFLPFAALRGGENDRFLVEDFTISYAPSASVLHQIHQDETRDPDGQPSVLVVGDPYTALRPLAHARSGAKRLAHSLETEALIGAAATERTVRSRSFTTQLLHIGAHASNLPSAPQLSHIALAADDVHDGNLTVREILSDLELDAQPLVVLSACSTARGDRTRGDDVIGLTHAFLAAGSPTVVSTLWPVDDAATEQLTRWFYSALAGGASVPEALRNAQQRLRADPDRAPDDWSAFVVTGDPRRTWERLWTTTGRTAYDSLADSSSR